MTDVDVSDGSGDGVDHKLVHIDGEEWVAFRRYDESHEWRLYQQGWSDEVPVRNPSARGACDYCLAEGVRVVGERNGDLKCDSCGERWPILHMEGCEPDRVGEYRASMDALGSEGGSMSEQSGDGVYRDEHYCCMDCGCEFFEECPGPRDRCNSCGSPRDNMRGPDDA